MTQILTTILMFASFAVAYGLITAEQQSKRSLPTSLIIGLSVAALAGVLLLAGVFN